MKTPYLLSVRTSVLLLSAAALGGCSDSSVAARDGAAAAPAVQTTAQTRAEGKAQGLFRTDTKRLFADYKQLCADQKPRSRDCEMLRSLVVAEVVMALQMTERSRDQRGVAEALKALDFPDEPEIIVTGLQILARFVDTPGIAAKVLPQVLKNRSVEVQRLGATLLSALPDQAVAHVGRQWINNHGGLDAKTPYDQYPDFPKHYASLGFPKYPGAEWYSPADSDRSIGWSTQDDAAAVAKWFIQALKAEAVDANQWQQLQNQEIRQSMQSGQTRTEQLVQKAIKGDQATKAELEKLAKEAQDAAAVMTKGFMNMTYPPSAGGEGRWIVAKKKDGRVSTVVLVYPMPGVQRTVIQVAWHLADYPSAWPKQQ